MVLRRLHVQRQRGVPLQICRGEHGHVITIDAVRTGGRIERRVREPTRRVFGDVSAGNARGVRRGRVGGGVRRSSSTPLHFARAFALARDARDDRLAERGTEGTYAVDESAETRHEPRLSRSRRRFAEIDAHRRAVHVRGPTAEYADGGERGGVVERGLAQSGEEEQRHRTDDVREYEERRTRAARRVGDEPERRGARNHGDVEEHGEVIGGGLRIEGEREVVGHPEEDRVRDRLDEEVGRGPVEDARDATRLRQAGEGASESAIRRF